MYNLQLSRRDFLRWTARGAVAVSTVSLYNKISTAIGALGGLAGVIATPKNSSAQDLTSQQMAEYAQGFYLAVEFENNLREFRRDSKSPRCYPQQPILHDGIIDGERVIVEVKKHDIGNEIRDYSLEMIIAPKDMKNVQRYRDIQSGKNSSSITNLFIDDGLKINLLSPGAYVHTVNDQTMEIATWLRGGYDLTKYDMPEEGCQTEIGRQRVCHAGSALYDPTGHRGEEVKTKPHLEGYYENIGHQALLERRKAELDVANAKYKKFFEVAIKRDIVRRKKISNCGA